MYFTKYYTFFSAASANVGNVFCCCLICITHVSAASLKVLGNDCGHRTLPESLEAQGSEGLRVKVAKAIRTMELADTVPAAATKVGRVASVAEGT